VITAIGPKCGTRSGSAGPALPPRRTQASATPKRTIREVRFQGGDPFQEQQLARLFQVKPKQTYRPLAVRKGTDRLLGFLQKQGYMEARVHVNREERDGGVWLTAEIRLGPLETVEFTGDSVPRSVRNRIRQAWQSGQTDKQRIAVAQQIVAGHYGRQGFLQAAAECKIQPSAGAARQVLFDVRRGRRYSNVHLEIEGASRDHREGILAMIRKAKLEEAVYAEPRRLTEAAVQYYRRLGYLAAEVDAPRQKIDEQAGTGQIVMHVTEGPAFRVGEIRFTGNHGLKENALRSDLPLSTGGTFEPARLSAAVTGLRRKYESQGYRDVLIEYELKPGRCQGVLDVAFTIQEKDQRVVQSVEIEGNRQTSDKFVRSQLTVSEGQPEDVSQVSQSIQNLSRTGAFASVDIESRLSGTNIAPQIGADLLVKLREGKPFRVQYGGLYSTSAGVGFIADFENHNSLGSARVLGVRTRYDANTQEVRLYLTQPVWGRTALSTTATTYVTHEKVADGVQQNKVGASVQQDWPFRAKYPAVVRVSLRKIAADGAAGRYPVGAAGAGGDRACLLHWLPRLARLVPGCDARGSFAALGTEIAPGWLGSDYGYLRWFGQYYKYFPLKKPQAGILRRRAPAIALRVCNRRAHWLAVGPESGSWRRHSCLPCRDSSRHSLRV
jgi:outer membrane protein assembly factor BamA